MEHKNSFFTPLIDTCKKNNLRYILIEEPDYNSNSKRNKDSVAKAFLNASHDLPVDESFRRDAIRRFSSNRFDKQMKEILYLNR